MVVKISVNRKGFPLALCRFDSHTGRERCFRRGKGRVVFLDAPAREVRVTLGSSQWRGRGHSTDPPLWVQK